MRHAATIPRTIGGLVPLVIIGFIAGLEGLLLMFNSRILLRNFPDTPLTHDLEQRSMLIAAAIVALTVPLGVAAWRSPDPVIAATWLRLLGIVLLIDPLGLTVVPALDGFTQSIDMGLPFAVLALAPIALAAVLCWWRWGGVVLIVAGLGLPWLFVPDGVFEFGPLVVTGVCLLAAGRRSRNDDAAAIATPEQGMLGALPPRTLRMLAGAFIALAVVGAAMAVLVLDGDIVRTLPQGFDSGLVKAVIVFLIPAAVFYAFGAVSDRARRWRQAGTPIYTDKGVPQAPKQDPCARAAVSGVHGATRPTVGGCGGARIDQSAAGQACEQRGRTRGLPPSCAQHRRGYESGQPELR